MRTILESAVTLALGAAVLSVIAVQLRPDFAPAVQSWRLGQEPAMPVQVAVAERGDVRHTISAPGRVEAETEVKISAEVPGRVDRLRVKEGDRVRKGDILVELDTVAFEAEVRTVESRLKRLEASLVGIQADLKKAERDVRRQKDLQDRAIDSKNAYLDACSVFDREEARLAAAQHEIREAESSLAKARDDLRKATIKCPQDGMVSQLLARQGEVAVVGTMNNPGTVLLTISTSDTLVVRARVNEANIALVQTNQPAQIHLQHDPRTAVSGTVLRVSPKGSKGTPQELGTGNDAVTFETVVRIDNPAPHVRMGMTANVEILVAERSSAVTVPAQAVVQRRARDLPVGVRPSSAGGGEPADRQYIPVVLVRRNGVAEFRVVRPGIGDRGRVEILEGLQPGEDVIVGPYRAFDRLREGTPVTELEPADARGGNP